MKTRRQVIQMSLATAALATMSRTAMAEEEVEPTDPKGEHTKNKVFTNVLEELPRCEKGTLSTVDWFMDEAGSRLICAGSQCHRRFVPHGSTWLQSS